MREHGLSADEYPVAHGVVVNRASTLSDDPTRNVIQTSRDGAFHIRGVQAKPTSQQGVHPRVVKCFNSGVVVILHDDVGRDRFTVESVH